MPGRGRRVVLDRVLLVLDEVEVVAAIGHGLGPLERALADGADRKAGRQREALLHTGQDHVQAPLVVLDLDAGHARNRIDQDDDLRIFRPHQLGDVGDRADDAGGGLVHRQTEGVEAAVGQGCVHELRGDRLNQ